MAAESFIVVVGVTTHQGDGEFVSHHRAKGGQELKVCKKCEECECRQPTKFYKPYASWEYKGHL